MREKVIVDERERETRGRDIYLRVQSGHDQAVLCEERSEETESQET